MELLLIGLGISFSTLIYFGFRFREFVQKENRRNQELNLKMACTIQELQQEKPPPNVFREMAINQLAKQTLVYIPETGCYERRRELD